jgi:hypothetical protein
MDYEKVISSNWMLFAPVFQSRGELTKHFLSVEELPQFDQAQSRYERRRPEKW